MQQQMNMTAGVPVDFWDVGDFFLCLSAERPVAVRFFEKGRVVHESVVVGGFSDRFVSPFDRFQLVTDSDQSVEFLTRFGGSVDYAPSAAGGPGVNPALLFSLFT